MEDKNKFLIKVADLTMTIFDNNNNPAQIINTTIALDESGSIIFPYSELRHSYHD